VKQTKVNDMANKTKVENEEATISRRSFLRKSAVVGGGVAGAVALPGQAAVTEVTEVPASKEEGYRETDHVSDYYKSARL
jgi:hypothetical protein